VGDIVCSGSTSTFFIPKKAEIAVSIESKNTFMP